jgi:RNA polymerase sigma factor (sigma-70 family)
MDDIPSIDACLARLAAGDLSARDRILELCADRLRILAQRMLGRFPGVRREADTDDVFQNAALRLHRALGSLAASGEAPRSLLALAATQVRRELIDLARRAGGPQSWSANHDTNAVPGGGGRLHVEEAVSAAESFERWEAFHAAIDGLPDVEREVVHLAWYLGASQTTIASVVGCSPRTVKNRWRSAREKIVLSLDGEPPA